MKAGVVPMGFEDGLKDHEQTNNVAARGQKKQERLLQNPADGVLEQLWGSIAHHQEV